MSPPAARPGYVDPRATRFGGALTAALATTALLAGSPYIAGALALVLLVGAFGGPAWNAWGTLYRVSLRRVLGPPPYLEPEEPPRFAQLLGGLVLASAVPFYFTGPSLAAVGLVAVVALLALVNATLDFCVGCKIYGLLLRRRHAARPHPARDE